MAPASQAVASTCPRTHSCALCRFPPRKHVPGFDRHVFKQDSLGLYRDVCRLLAAGDRSSLRQLVTPAGGEILAAGAGAEAGSVGHAGPAGWGKVVQRQGGSALKHSAGTLLLLLASPQLLSPPPPPPPTSAVFSDMKRQLRQREEGGWARVQWEMTRVRRC